MVIRIFLARENICVWIEHFSNALTAAFPFTQKYKFVFVRNTHFLDLLAVKKKNIVYTII